MTRPLTAAALLALAVSTTLPAAAHAQGHGGMLGVSARLNGPIGDLGDWHQPGVGLGVAGEYDLSSRWTVTGELGYNRFPGKTIRGVPDGAPDLGQINLGAGVRRYLEDTQLYLGAEFGHFAWRSRREHVSTEDLRRDYGLLPTVGWRSGTFDMAAQMKLGGTMHWLQVRWTAYLVRF